MNPRLEIQKHGTENLIEAANVYRPLTTCRVLSKMLSVSHHLILKSLTLSKDCRKGHGKAKLRVETLEDKN